jgi:hypothetical protein
MGLNMQSQLQFHKDAGHPIRRQSDAGFAAAKIVPICQFQPLADDSPHGASQRRMPKGRTKWVSYLLSP